MDLGGLAPVERPDQGLEGLDVVPGLLLRKLREHLADLGRALARSADHCALDLERRAGRLLSGLEAAAGLLATSCVTSTALSAVRLPSSATLSVAFLASVLAICTMMVFLRCWLVRAAGPRCVAVL